MGRVYVFLDRFLTHEDGPILGIEIDDDFEKMNRHQLCRYIEAKFGWEDDDFGVLNPHRRLECAAKLQGTTNSRG